MGSLGFFDVLGAPLALLALFALVLAYLGVHILRRQVIFVDLALGQVAALGVLLGYQFGLAPASVGAQVFAVGATLLAAGLFAVTRGAGGRVPQEAIVGVVFAVANALTFIVVDRSAHGAEHVADILAGVLLWTTWGALGRAALVVGVAVAALAAAHRRLVALSAEGPARGERGALVDFVFFACFGLVISATVRTAGVLPTFAMLVGPAIVGGLAAASFAGQFVVAATLSAAVGALALTLTFAFDLPAGPALVVLHGLALGTAALGFGVLRAASRGRAAAQAAGGLALACLLVLAVIGGGRWLSHQAWANPDLPATAEAGGGERR